MYDFMSLKLRKRNHPSLRGCFSGMPLIPVPIGGGVKMSSKLFTKWLFDIVVARHERNWSLVFFCRWVYFHFRSKIFLWPPSPPCIRHRVAKHLSTRMTAILKIGQSRYPTMIGNGSLKRIGCPPSRIVEIIF